MDLRVFFGGFFSRWVRRSIYMMGWDRGCVCMYDLCVCGSHGYM